MRKQLARECSRLKAFQCPPHGEQPGQRLWEESAACSRDGREAGGAGVPGMRGEQCEMRLEEQACKSG